jgi:sulfur relay (sulfurtransferase) DsrF/TusC family protein
MADKTKKPKWLKRLKKLMKSQDESDRQALKESLEKLKLKANELKADIDAAESEAEREILMEKWALVNKHRKKGIKKLLGEE